jgi:multidrug efflux pump subunit AcrA (membrane-fusion protein)
MIRVLLTLMGIVVTCLVCVAVALGRGHTLATASPDRTAPVPATPAAAPIVEVSPWLAVVVPAGEVEVTAPVAGGRIAELTVHLGDHVEAGAVVARLDPDRARQGITEAHARLAAREAERRQALARRAQARDALDRIVRLGVFVAAGERAQASFAVAAAQADLDRATAEGRVQRLLIDQLEVALRDTTIVAPIAGEVSARVLDGGAHIEGGAVLVRLVGEARLLRIAVPPEDTTPSVGAAIEARCGGRSIRAVVTHVAPGVDAAARVVLVEATPDRSDALRLGDACTAAPP